MEGLQLKATAHVKISKYDEDGALIGVEEHDVELTEKEAEALWHSQQQE
jgi:hypothetical protein